MAKARTKICAACGKRKQVRFFHHNKNCKDGRVHKCKPCLSDYGRRKRAVEKEWYQSRSKIPLRDFWRMRAIPDASAVPWPRFLT